MFKSLLMFFRNLVMFPVVLLGTLVVLVLTLFLGQEFYTLWHGVFNYISSFFKAQKL